jgi:hypothetical protein
VPQPQERSRPILLEPLYLKGLTWIRGRGRR